MDKDKDYIYSVYRWAAIIHIVGFSIFAATLIVFWFLGFSEFNLLIILGFLVPLIIAVNTFLLFIGSKISKNIIGFYALFFINIAATTAIIHFSGGQDSPFPFLYLITAISASLVSWKLLIGVGSFTIALFLFLIYFEPPEGIQFLVFVRLLRLLLLGAIVVFQAYFFISRIKKRDEEMIEMHDEFLFKTVHELRSPSLGIRWAIEKFSSPQYLERNPDAKEFLSDLHSMNEKKIRLLKDLVLIAKGNQPDISFKKKSVDLKTIIGEILKELEQSFNEKQLKIIYSPQENIPQVLGDPDHIYEVFVNLIDNAAKYNKNGGSITIAHELKDNFLETKISDTGIGIDKKGFSKLFTPYFRVVEDGIPGTGLGLFIVKQLLEKMGGSIKVDSKIDQGTQFTVYLPTA